MPVEEIKMLVRCICYIAYICLWLIYIFGVNKYWNKKFGFLDNLGIQSNYLELPMFYGVWISMHLMFFLIFMGWLVFWSFDFR